MRYALDITYHGAAYGGWQIQPNAPTVQAEIEQAMETLLRHQVAIMGAGRTDAGVHARQMIAHFDSEEELGLDFLHSLNGILPSEVAVNQLFAAEKTDFHARFDAILRGYEYQVVTRKSPLWEGLAAWTRRKLDWELMNQAAQMLLLYEDFGAFCKAHGANKTTICKIEAARWEQREELWVFVIRADRFLRGMVRAIVGTLMDVGSGKITLEEWKSIIESGDRKKAGAAAPAQGLFLQEVLYPPGYLRSVAKVG